MGIIRTAAGYLAGKGVETPRLDAEVMLADLLGLSRVELYINFDRPLDAHELAGFRERVRRRAAREPVSYITGKKEFYSLEFAVGPEVLIPRPETELMVDEAAGLARNRWPDHERLLLMDLGAGCGAVAAALASQLENSVIRVIDVSGAALDTARANADRLGFSDRMIFMKGDLLGPVAGLGLRFHIIAANLPYVPRAAFADMSPEVREYEPRLALDGGQDGLDLIRRAVARARECLEPDGALLLEIWPTHAPEIRALGSKHGYPGVRIIKDLHGRDRVAVLDMKEAGD